MADAPVDLAPRIIFARLLVSSVTGAVCYVAAYHEHSTAIEGPDAAGSNSADGQADFLGALMAASGLPCLARGVGWVPWLCMSWWVCDGLST